MYKKKVENPLFKRARSKYFTNSYLLKLVDLDSPLNKSYWNTFYCASNLVQKNERITGKYCKNRWCTVCNRIRIAQLIQGYSSQISDFKKPYFITLTVPNCSELHLDETIDKMFKSFKKMIDIFRKRNTPIKGILKIEITYNYHENTFHPHFHLLIDVDTFNDAFFILPDSKSPDYQTVFNNFRAMDFYKDKKDIFLENLTDIQYNVINNLWLSYFPTAQRVAQFTTQTTQNTDLEIFKYFTKIITKVSDKYQFSAYAMDVIFKQMRKKQVFRVYGLKKINEEIDEILSVEVDEIDEKYRLWQYENCDWFDVSTGEALTQYEPTEYQLELRNQIRN